MKTHLFLLGICLAAASLAASDLPLNVFDRQPQLKSVETIDFSLNMELVANVSWTSGHDVAVSGEFLYCFMAHGLITLSTADPFFIFELELPPTEYGGMDMKEDYIYLVTESRLYIVDASIPYSTVLESTLELPGPNRAIQVVDTLACISGSGLRIVNVSDPENPSLLSEYNTAINTFDISLAGNLAFVAGESDGSNGGILWIMDIDDPSAPNLLGTMETDYTLRNVTIDGELAYLLQAGDPGMLVVNIVDPLLPYVIGSYPKTGNDLELQDTLAVIAGEQIEILNVADPEAPSGMSTVDLWNPASAVTLSDSVAYIAYGPIGICLMDISDPENPEWFAGFTPRDQANDVEIAYEYAFVAGEKLRILDVKNPDSIQLVGSYDLPGVAWRVAFSRNFVYVTDQNKHLYVINIAVLANPTLAAIMPTYGYVTDIEIQGSYLYLADTDSVLVIVNISDPYQPYIEGHASGPVLLTGGLSIEGNYAYVAGSGLSVFDISNPQAPSYVSSGIVFGWVEDVDVFGEHAYVAAMDDEVTLLPMMTVHHIADSTNIFYEAGRPVFEDPFCIEYRDGYAYVGGLFGVNILDVSDLDVLLRHAGWFKTPALTFGLAVSGDFVYLADYCSLVILRFLDRRCGDVNGDNTVNVGDAVYLVCYIFQGGPPPVHLCVSDTDGDGTINVGDAVYIINYVFKGGAPPDEACCFPEFSSGTSTEFIR